MSNRFVSLSDVILTLIEKLNLQKEMTIYHICEHWEEIVGLQIALHTAPEKLSFDTLYLCVDSAPWMNQLTFFKKEIIEKTNRFLQKRIINEVFFKLTLLPPAPKKEVLNFDIANQNAILVSEEVIAMEDALNLLEDTETRKKIVMAVTGYFQKGPIPGKMSTLG